MKITLDQIRKLISTYKLKALQIQPMTGGYLVETNQGRKAIGIWENADLARWSNRWREELYKQGYREVERFLVNRSKKKYIRYQGKCFVLSDAPPGRSPSPENQAECQAIGELLAQVHLAVERVKTEGDLVQPSPLDDRFFSHGLAAIKRIIESIEKNESPALLDEVMYLNMPLLFQRVKRAYQLWEKTKDDVQQFPVSFSSFHLDQLVETENGWFIRGVPNQSISRIHQDTSQLICEIYERSGWNKSSVTAFLEGYERYRKLSRQELVYVLAHLAVPWEVWDHIRNAVQFQPLSDEQADGFIEAIGRQRHWDELTVHIAKFIDAKKELTA